MKRRIFFGALASVSLAVVVASAAQAQGSQVAQPLRVLTHGSFDLPKELLAQFERDAGVKLEIVKAGDAGEMVNKLILTRANPIADVVFGIDNTLLPRAQKAGVLQPYSGPSSQRAALAFMTPQGDQVGALAASGVVPVDYGYVTLNIDKAWFAKSGLALPTTLAELAQPNYKDLLVVQHPATSSPGQAFMLATIAGLGEKAAFDWWAAMRANGVKVVKGWTEAYYTEFTRNGGTRPIVVSYASSPAAEVFYSKEKITDSPTANLFLKGGVFRQVEGVALVKGGNPAAQKAAGRFIEFLRSGPAQQALQTTMWMFPVEPGVARAEVMQHATEPQAFNNPDAAQMGQKGKAWQQRWIQTVLK